MPRDRDTYRRGGFWRIDERTGFRERGYDTQKEWTGTIVAKEDFEPRHPQDFVRGRRDNMAVPDPRPEPTDVNQIPPGGPFILVLHDGGNQPCFLIADGGIRVLNGVTQISPSDL